MAKPIKETPILKGKDAKKFLQENDMSIRDAEAVKKERERILKNYNLLKQAETFNRHIQS